MDGHYRYTPFGDGIRMCVGQSLAKMELIASLAVLFSRFSFRLADEVNYEGLNWMFGK